MRLRDRVTTWFGNGDFEFDRKTGTIIDYKGTKKHVVIPEIIKGVEVSIIGNHSFEDAMLDSVVLPSTLKSIGDFAFCGSELEVIEIPNSVVDIGAYAYGNNRISKLNIPEGVVSIGNCSFVANHLVDVDIPNSLIESVGAFDLNTDADGEYSEINFKFTDDSSQEIIVFTGKDSFLYSNDFLEGVKITEYKDFLFDKDTGTITEYIGKNRNIDIPSKIDGVEVSIIGRSAFANIPIESVGFPETVHTIESYAFNNCKLKKLDFKDHIRNVESNSFTNNDIEEVQCFAKSHVNISELAFDDDVSINYHLISISDEQLLEMLKDENFNFEHLYHKYDYSDNFNDKYVIGTIQGLDFTRAYLNPNDYINKVKKMLPIAENDVVNSYVTYTKDPYIINKIIEMENEAYSKAENISEKITDDSNDDIIRVEKINIADGTSELNGNTRNEINFQNTQAKTLIITKGIMDQLAYQTLISNPHNNDYLTFNDLEGVVDTMKYNYENSNFSNINKIVSAFPDDYEGHQATVELSSWLAENKPEVEFNCVLPKSMTFSEDLNNKHDQGMQNENMIIRNDGIEI